MNAQQNSGRTSVGKWLVVIGLIVALASAAAMILSGIGYRLGLYHFRTGFAILGWAFWFALAGIAIGVAAAYIPWSYKQTAGSLPYIHDISTDTENPPEFVAAATLRKPGDHPVAYDGKEVADLQHKAYADLAPLTTKASKEKVFEAAKAALLSMGMHLADADPTQGRIEANHTSLLYGFTDDMVVRIATDADGTKVDARSKSRVGRSDLGQNAKRIRTFLGKLRASLG